MVIQAFCPDAFLTNKLKNQKRNKKKQHNNNKKPSVEDLHAYLCVAIFHIFNSNLARAILIHHLIN